VSISIRQRLTLWYTAAVAVLLGIAAIGLLLAHFHLSLQRLDAELLRLDGTVATVFQDELKEGLAPKAAAEDCLTEAVIQGRHIAIMSADGALLGQRWTFTQAPSFDVNRPDAAWTVDGPQKYRVVSTSAPPVPQGYVIVGAAPWSEIEEDRVTMIHALYRALPVAFVVAVLGLWWIAGRAIRPAALMAEEARHITEHSTNARLTAVRGDELGQLATAFNELVDRLETALDVRRRFLAEASHELRTPVSIARTAADVALARSGRSESEYRDSLTVVSEQMKRLTRMVSDMLALARTDAADWPLTRHDFYFDELVTEVGRAARLLAEQREVSLDVACPPDLQFHGDEDLLRQMLLNLVENAVRHSPQGGRVQVQAVTGANLVGVDIRDTGPGIAEADRDRIFNRYVRVGSPGSSDGLGLGLVIARRIARAHGGDVTLSTSGPGGTTFHVTLPFSSAAT
jgi:signal transduction histidine kinase